MHPEERSTRKPTVLSWRYRGWWMLPSALAVGGGLAVVLVTSAVSPSVSLPRAIDVTPTPTAAPTPQDHATRPSPSPSGSAAPAPRTSLIVVPSRPVIEETRPDSADEGSESDR
jgi:hypothetical protein